MLCTDRIKNNIEKEIKRLTFNYNLKSKEQLDNLAFEVNEMFGYNVVSFNENKERVINIPYNLISDYKYDNRYFDPKVYFIPKPLTDKYIQLLEMQKSKIENEISNLNSKKRKFSTNKEYVRNIIKRVNSLYHILNKENGINETITKLKKISSFDSLKLYIEQDIAQIKQLSKSDNIKDLERLKDLLDFYINLDPFSDIYKNENITHPFYLKSEFFKEDGSLKESMKEVVKYLQEISNIAKEKSIELHNKERNIIKEIVNQEVSKKSEIDKLFEARKDINKLEWIFLPPSHSSRNDISVKVLEKKLLNSINKEMKYAQSIENEIESIEKALLKTIKKLFPNLKRSELYSIFREKDKNGNFTSNIISKFHSLIYKEEYKNKNKWNKERFNKILKITDKEIRNNKLKILKKKIFNWYRTNFHFIDIRKIDISDIIEEYPNLFNEVEIKYDEKYNNFLKSLLGEKGYEEEIKKAKDKIRSYIVDFELEIEKLKSELDEGLITEEEYKKSIYYFRLNHNPINFLKTLEDSRTIQNIYNYDKDVYLHKIPRKYKARIENDKVVETKEETGYYNKDFDIIENNEILYKFYKILRDFSKDVYNVLDVNDKKGFTLFSIPAYEKTFSEIIADDTLNYYQRFIKAIRYMLSKLKDAFRENIESVFSYSYTNPITGRVSYNINNNFLKSHNKTIYTIFNTKRLKITSLLNIKKDVINLKSLPEWKLKALATIFEINPNDFSRLFSDDLEHFRVFDNLKSIVTDRVIKNGTMDLGKVIKTTVYNIALYKARQEILPFAEIVKKHYTSIQKPLQTKDEQIKVNTNNEILYEGTRKRANEQFEAWFNRNILGNYNKKSSFGKYIKTKIGKTGSKKMDNILSKIGKKLENISYFDTEDDKLIKQIDEILLINPENLNKKDLKILKGLEIERNRLKKHFSLTAALMSMLSYLRVLGLSYNLSAAVTNFMEGQISLMLNLNGFVSEDIFWESMKIAKYAIIKNYFIPRTKKQKLESDLARTLMDNYDILQDAYNELQKATVKSKLNKFYKLNHKEVVSRVEYLNQMPILIMALKKLKIKDYNGNEDSIWNAFMEGAKEGRIGYLGKRFSSPENRYNFEINSKEDLESIFNKNPLLEGKERKKYNELKNIASELIKRTQGDYSEVGGNIAGDTIEGLIVMLFRRWLPMIVNTHFKNKDYNIYTNLYEKGRKRSFNAALGGLHLGLASALFFGVPASIFGFAAGAGIVTTIPYFRAKRVETQNLGFVKELAVHTLQLIKTTIGIPVNLAFGKNVISSEVKRGKVGKWNEQLKKSYSTVDYNNIIGNLREMAIILLLTGALLLTKASLYDDDDKEKDRPLHNVLVNKIMQLSKQLLAYTNPVEAYNNFTDLAFFKFIQNVGKSMDKFINYLEGNDIILTGVNRGESALSNQLQKTFLPVFLREKIGFGNSSEKQFENSVFDSYFWSEEKIAKKQIQALRAKYKRKILDKYDNDKYLNRAVYKVYKTKRKNESYVELLKKFEKTELN